MADLQSLTFILIYIRFRNLNRVFLRMYFFTDFQFLIRDISKTVTSISLKFYPDLNKPFLQMHTSAFLEKMIFSFFMTNFIDVENRNFRQFEKNTHNMVYLQKADMEKSPCMHL